MNIGYGYHLTHLPTRFVFRRSDILVSSTLSITLTPLERGFERKNLVEMTEEELTRWIDLRYEFTSKNIKHQVLPHHGSNYCPAYYTNLLRMTMKAGQSPQFQSSSTPSEAAGFIFRQQTDMAATILKGPSDEAPPSKLLPACLLREPLTPEQQQLLHDEERRQYNMQKAKHEVHMRTNKKQKAENYVEKKLTLVDARKLWKGIYYEVEDDDFDEATEGVN